MAKGTTKKTIKTKREQRLEHLICELIWWAYEVNGNQGAQDAIEGAGLTKKEIKELELESYYEEE